MSCVAGIMAKVKDMPSFYVSSMMLLLYMFFCLFNGSINFLFLWLTIIYSWVICFLFTRHLASSCCIWNTAINNKHVTMGIVWFRINFYKKKTFCTPELQNPKKLSCNEKLYHVQNTLPLRHYLVYKIMHKFAR